MREAWSGGGRAVWVGVAAALAAALAATPAAAAMQVRWAPVGSDAPLPAFDVVTLAAPSGTPRVVGLDWESGGFLVRTLRLAGSEWKAVGTSGAPTLGVEGAVLAEGPGDTVVALAPHDALAGTPAATWVLDGATWTHHVGKSAEEDRYRAAAAFDVARGVTVVFGGYGDCPTTDCASTIEWDGEAWHVVAKGGPSPRIRASMAYAKGRGVVLFGGEDRSGHVLDDTWAWDGTAWSEVSTATRPPPRVDAPMAWDPTREVVALVGGTDVETPDVWTLDAGGWQLATTDGPAPADKHASDSFPGIVHAALRADPGGGLLLVASPTMSVGTWRAHLARGLGAPCAAPGECASAFCADGVCCDGACDGACDACSVGSGSTTDGACSPRARGDDGAPSCGAARCDGVGPACPTTCADDDLCAPGSRCVAGACTEAACSDDGLSLRTADAPRSCAPYRCRTGACLDVCASGQDCAPGNVCGTDGRCGVAPAATGGDAASGGCATGDRGDAAGGALLVALACLLARRRR